MPETERLPRRLLMTADTVGGVWNYSLELAAGLAAHGVEVGLATMGARLSPVQHRELSRLPDVTLFESDYRLEWMNDPWAEVEQAGRWLLELEHQFRPDLIHLNGYAHGALDWQRPVLIAGHSCVLSWWQAVKQAPAPADWQTYRQAVQAGLRRAGLVVAPSRATLADLEHFYGPLPAGRVVPNGRPDNYRPGPRQPQILSVGRLWDEAKNIRALEQVAPNLDWPVYLAGEQRHPDGGASPFNRVKLLGKLAGDELAGWYASSAIYALPAFYEPFGLSILEAALGGCALVLGDIPSLREIWGEAALFVPPGDTARLQAAIKSLIGSPELLARMAAQARRRAGEYTPERMVGGYLAAYRALLGAAQFRPLPAPDHFSVEAGLYAS